jgi:hypothetical protein
MPLEGTDAHYGGVYCAMCSVVIYILIPTYLSYKAEILFSPPEPIAVKKLLNTLLEKFLIISAK